MSIPARSPLHSPLPPPVPVQPLCPYTVNILRHPLRHFQSSIHIPSYWLDYPKHIEPWETAILPTNLPSIVITFIRDANLGQATIYHCSDGSSQAEKGSFGWAFGPNATLVFSHSGPAFGVPMDSYLAESYGLLSSSCFWFRALKMVLRRQPQKFKLHFYCDNKSLIRRVNEFLSHPDGSFRRSLTPNYDVVFLIASVLRQFPPHLVQLSHVKGHQDATQPTHQLPWPAQLNVHADRLANQYVNQIPLPLPTPFLPSAQIHLRDSQNDIVIKRWNFHLRSVYFGKQYTDWLCRQHSWDPSTVADVDFEGLDLALRSLPTHLRRFATKWINHSLPVRRRVHRYDPLIPPTCKFCPTITECDNHLLRCPSTERRSACAEAFGHLNDKLHFLHTEPILHQTILHLISEAFDIPTCTPPTHTDHALSRQDIIGRFAFLKGRWSSAFRTRQEHFSRSQRRPPTYSGNRWMKLVLVHMFEQLHGIWQCRNVHTHGVDQALQEQFLREQLTVRVDAVYNQMPNLLAHDRHAFEHLSKADLLSGPTTTIQTWLRMVEPTLQRCLHDANTKLRDNQSDIRDYFDEASYVDSEASDTTLSFDTFDQSGTVIFNPSSISSSSFSASLSSWSDSHDGSYTDSDVSSLSV